MAIALDRHVKYRMREWHNDEDEGRYLNNQIGIQRYMLRQECRWEDQIDIVMDG